MSMLLTLSVTKKVTKYDEFSTSYSKFYDYTIELILSAISNWWWPKCNPKSGGKIPSSTNSWLVRWTFISIKIVKSRCVWLRWQHNSPYHCKSATLNSLNTESILFLHKTQSNSRKQSKMKQEKHNIKHRIKMQI